MIPTSRNSRISPAQTPGTYTINEYRFVSPTWNGEGIHPESPGTFTEITEPEVVRKKRRALKRGYRKIRKAYGHVLPVRYRKPCHANKNRTRLVKILIGTVKLGEWREEKMYDTL